MPSALSQRLRTLAVTWVAVAGIGYVVDLLRQTQDHLTNGAGRPFGDDFINFWSAAALALRGSVATIYDLNAFHAFETAVAGAAIDFYHYSYPPTLMVLTAPLGLVPYVPALFVWLIAGWLCFYAALRVARPQAGTWLLALAAPAVFINAVGGQNGTWTAALLGGGLSLLERRPSLAGVLFGLLTYKPQLGLLVPIALLAGRHFRAFLVAAVTAVALVLVSVLLFGAPLWPTYFHHASVLQHVILENSTGVWHRMISVFIFARRIGADVPTAYVVQAAVGLCAAAVVAVAWFRETPAAAKNALLVLGTCLATPYLQDYDLVVGVFVAVWLVELYGPVDESRPALVGAGLILLVPFLASPLAHFTGYDVGPLFIAPVFVVAAQAAFTRSRSGDSIASASP